ncbi:hypothetical protein DIPPA_27629 [Diplonema papillatum]|nr:hypothetical protein DIPPA_27629 [Diplonema papillatum]
MPTLVRWFLIGFLLTTILFVLTRHGEADGDAKAYKAYMARDLAALTAALEKKSAALSTPKTAGNSIRTQLPDFADDENSFDGRRRGGEDTQPAGTERGESETDAGISTDSEASAGSLRSQATDGARGASDRESPRTRQRSKIADSTTDPAEEDESSPTRLRPRIADSTTDASGEDGSSRSEIADADAAADDSASTEAAGTPAATARRPTGESVPEARAPGSPTAPPPPPESGPDPPPVPSPVAAKPPPVVDATPMPPMAPVPRVVIPESCPSVDILRKKIPVYTITSRQYSLRGGVAFTMGMLPRVAQEAEFNPKIVARGATPDAPTGDQALHLARSWGLPDHWNARIHPTLFILGTTRSGTTFLERCYSSGALVGSADDRPYPRSSARWPPSTDAETGEPIASGNAFLKDGAWNRTGFRRFDLPKAPQLYSFHNPTQEAFYKRFESLPPVEPDARSWRVLDATPVYIARPEAAESVHSDHCFHAEKPRFLVSWREPIDRAFSQLVMAARTQGPPAGGTSPFSAALEEEFRLWSRPECEPLRLDPDAVVLRYTAPQLRKLIVGCFPRTRSYLLASLPVIGLRYWLHFFKGKQFTVVKYESLATADPWVAINTLADAFDMRAIPKPCAEGREMEWKSGDCTGPVLWARVRELCASRRADDERRPASATAQAEQHGIPPVSPEERERYRRVFARYEALMHTVIETFKVRYVGPAPGQE